MSETSITAQFGASVRSLRFRLGISQEELAERADLHRTYIAGIEAGGRNITLKNIDKLARALKVSTSDLLAAPGAAPLRPDDPRICVPPGQLVDILLVEDSADDVDLAIRALRVANIGNQIHVVRDGAAALSYLFRTDEYAQRSPIDCPQLVLLDLNLPKIGGLEVLRQIRADPRTRAMPVIMLTASERDQDIITARRLGADAYLVKPVGFHNLSDVTPKLSLQWTLLKPMVGQDM